MTRKTTLTFTLLAVLLLAGAGTLWAALASQGWQAETRIVPTDLKNLSALTWDGTGLWITADTQGRAYHVDPDSGAVDRSIPLPAKDTGGSAWDGRTLWQLAYVDKKIHRIDPATGAVLATIPSPGRGMCSGMTWDGRYLWLANWEDERIYQIDQEDGGRVLRSVPGELEFTGLAWDGRYLWTGVLVGTETHDEAPPFTGFVQQLDVDTRRALRVFPVNGVTPGGSDWLPGQRLARRFWWYDHHHARVVELRLRHPHEEAGRATAGLLLLLGCASGGRAAWAGARSSARHQLSART